MITTANIPVSTLAKNIPKTFAKVPKNIISNPIPGIVNKYFSRISPKNIAPIATKPEVIILEIWAILISVVWDWFSGFDK